MNLVTIDCSKIHDWESFHHYFKKEFGFPDFYGRNMDAWIDCMTYLDEDDEMSTIKIKNGAALTLQLQNIGSLKKRSPEIYEALLECSAFVNFRRINNGEEPILILSFFQ